MKTNTKKTKDIFQDIENKGLIEIKTMNQFEELIALLLNSKETLFFRGQSDYDYELKSSYLRDGKVKFNSEVWRQRLDFIKDGYGEIEDINILAQLQHYVGKTILIDLTSRLLNAIWFSVSSQDAQNNDSALYVFKYGQKIKNKIESLEEEKIVYKCPIQIERGLSQNSYFILDNIDWKTEEREMYLKIKLDKKHKKDILKFLTSKQITAANIFPDLEGLMKEFEYSSPIFLFDKGNTLYSLKKYEEAIVQYDKAIELDSNNTNTHTNKGNSLLKLNKTKKAIAQYDIAIKLNSKDAKAYSNKGIALAMSNMFEEAIKVFDKAIKLDPNNTEVYYNKGNTLFESNKPKEAIIQYDKAIELDANDESSYFNKGIVHANLKEYKKAIEAFDKTIKLNYNHVNAHYNKGNILLKLGKKKKAEKEFDIVSKLDPEFKNKMKIW